MGYGSLASRLGLQLELDRVRVVIRVRFRLDFTVRFKVRFRVAVILRVTRMRRC